MRRVLLISFVCALCTVPLGLAADTPGDGSLSVKRGKGSVVMKLNGTVLGRVAKNGRVQVRDFKPLDGNVPTLTCAPHKKQRVSLGVWLCKGRNIGFRVENGRFNVNIRGTGISISAIGRGQVTVDGVGDTGVPDGVMSLDDGPWTSLPDLPTAYFLGTPPTRR
jgi:hypothetical protein